MATLITSSLISLRLDFEGEISNTHLWITAQKLKSILSKSGVESVHAEATEFRSRMERLIVSHSEIRELRARTVPETALYSCLTRLTECLFLLTLCNSLRVKAT